MGKITDMNTRALENAENYDDAKLNGLFDAKEFCTELSNLINSKGLKIDEILDHCYISRSYLMDMKNPSKNIQPKRNKILDLCLGINASVPRCKHGEPCDSSFRCPDLCTAFRHCLCLACCTGWLACKLFNLLCGS